MEKGPVTGSEKATVMEKGPVTGAPASLLLATVGDVVSASTQLVDPSRHHGGSYRAANWVALGATTGRGRMDRYGRRAGEAPKTVLVYPLVRDAKRRLREG